MSNDDLARLEYNHEWYRDSPWDSFDPSKLAADQLEKMAMTLTPQTASSDAWLGYDRLLADGEISIAVHFGWDYWDRYDLKGSRNLYNYLVDKGFASPVASYDELDRTSGPLTKTIQSNGKPVVVKVWIFHPGDPANHVLGPDPDTDAGGKILEADMRDSLAHREVIVFEGHSGPLYGFALANWRKTDEGDMDDSKLPTATMPKQLSDRARQRLRHLRPRAGVLDEPGEVEPRQPQRHHDDELLERGDRGVGGAAVEGAVQPDEQQAGAGEGVGADQGARRRSGLRLQSMYGVHGVDHNPKYDPMSDASKLCAACTTNAACGADGNRCTKISSSQKGCTFELHRRQRLPDGLRLPRGGERDVAHHQDAPVRADHPEVPLGWSACEQRVENRAERRRDERIVGASHDLHRRRVDDEIRGKGDDAGGVLEGAVGVEEERAAGALVA